MHWLGMARRSALPVLGCTTLSAALLGACNYTYEGEPPEAPLVIDPAPAEVGEPLDLDVPAGPSGLFASSRWPSACELLTDDEITAVLPQATVTEREADGQEYRDVDTLQTFTVAEGSCSYRLDIPEADLEPVDTMISVTLDAAGSPDVVERNVTAAPEDTTIDVPTGECRGREGRATVVCHEGPLAFTLSAIVGRQQRGSDTWTDRYEVAGETVTFTGRFGGDRLDEAGVEENEFLRDTLSAELAKIILVKI